MVATQWIHAQLALMTARSCSLMPMLPSIWRHRWLYTTSHGMLERSSACAKILIDSSANVEHPKRPLDARPLYVASQCGNADCVQLLIDSGAEVDAENTQTHCNALSVASTAGSALR